MKKRKEKKRKLVVYRILPSRWTTERKWKKKTNKKRKDGQTLRPYQRTKTAVEHLGDINCSRCTWNSPQRIEKEIGTGGNQGKIRVYSDYSIVEIPQNTERNTRDRGRLFVTHTLVKTYHPMLAWKTRKEWNNNNMNNPGPVLENDTHKLLWDLDIQTDHLISARRPDLITINNKIENLQNCRLCYSGWPQNKTERMWKER